MALWSSGLWSESNLWNKLMVGQMSRCFKVFCNFVNKPTKTFAACCKFLKKSMFNEYSNDWGPMVKRLRHRPFTAVSRVQIPVGSPFLNFILKKVLSFVLEGNHRVTTILFFGFAKGSSRRFEIFQISNPTGDRVRIQIGSDVAVFQSFLQLCQQADLINLMEV